MLLQSEIVHPRRFILAVLAVAVLAVVGTSAARRSRIVHRHAASGEAYMTCFAHGSHVGHRFHLRLPR